MRHFVFPIRHFGYIMSVLLFAGIFLFALRNFWVSDFPLFEEIILSSTLSAIINCAFHFKSRKRKQMLDSMQTVVYLHLIGFLLAIVVLPNSLLNVDRSRSLYVLSWVDQNKVDLVDGKLALNVNSLEASDVAGISMRLAEQEKRGLISRTQGDYLITSRGRVIVSISNVLARLFRLNNWEANKN